MLVSGLSSCKKARSVRAKAQAKRALIKRMRIPGRKVKKDRLTLFICLIVGVEFHLVKPLSADFRKHFGKAAEPDRKNRSKAIAPLFASVWWYKSIDI